MSQRSKRTFDPCSGLYMRHWFVCRECGGWYPNPGVFSRLGAMTGLIVGVVLLAVAGLIFVSSPDAWGLWGFLGFFGLLGVGRGILRPYGKPPVA